jgi:hypothetical protein
MPSWLSTWFAYNTLQSPAKEAKTRGITDFIASKETACIDCRIGVHRERLRLSFQNEPEN